MSAWHKIRAGLYERPVSATGRYEVGHYRTPWGWRWVLSYHGAHSGDVGYFDTLRAAKEYVAAATFTPG